MSLNIWALTTYGGEQGRLLTSRKLCNHLLMWSLAILGCFVPPFCRESITQLSFVINSSIHRALFIQPGADNVTTWLTSVSRLSSVSNQRALAQMRKSSDCERLLSSPLSSPPGGVFPLPSFYPQAAFVPKLSTWEQNAARNMLFPLLISNSWQWKKTDGICEDLVVCWCGVL